MATEEPTTPKRRSVAMPDDCTCAMWDAEERLVAEAAVAQLRAKKLTKAAAAILDKYKS